MAASALAKFDSTRYKILLVLTMLISADIVLAILGYGPTDDSQNMRTAVTNLEVAATAGTAAAFATYVMARQGIGGLHGKTYAALAIGSALWFIGESLWTYYEVGLRVSLPSYSMADVVWLLGYGFFGYHLFKMYLYFAKSVKKTAVLLVGVLVGLAISYLVYLTVLAADAKSSDGLVTLAFRASYPIGDSVLILPSIRLLVTLRKAKLHFSPWFFITLSLLITAAADMVFSYLSLAELAEIEWIANLLYNSAYMCIAGGLYWYNRFVIFDEKKAAGDNKELEKPDQQKSSDQTAF